MRRVLASLLAVCCLALSACASDGGPDPWEGMNRGVFAFNETVDEYALAPVARGWRAITPKFVRTGLSNFFAHLDMPRILLNDMLQLKGEAVAYDIVRIITNTTFGLAGFIDVASRENVPKSDEDFGQTLGAWGMPSGPYWVLPLFGPSNPRDTVGFIADAFSAPQSYFIPLWASVAEGTVEIVNLRSEFLEEVEQNRAESLDYYVFLRNAYIQNRRKKVEDLEAVPEESQDDLYFFDEDFDDFEDEEASDAQDDVPE